MDYEQALIAARALYEASQVPAETADSISTLVLSAAAATEAVRAEVTARVVALWRATDPRNVDSLSVFVQTAAQLMKAGQQAVTESTAASQVRQLAALGVDVRVDAVSADDVRGSHRVVTAAAQGDPVPARAPGVKVGYRDGPDRRVSRDESSTDRVFTRVAKEFAYATSQGKSDVEANAAAEKRIGSLVEDNVMLAQRNAEHQVLAAAAEQSDDVSGYRRLIHPELSKGGVCGLCVAASDRMYKIDTLKAVHKRCKCTVSAVTREHDPGRELNRRDMRMLYDRAGGTSGKRLKRTRYVIDEKGELGPVLAPVKGEPIPQYVVDLDAPASVV